MNYDYWIRQQWEWPEAKGAQFKKKAKRAVDNDEPATTKSFDS
jgi:hypothetical protein